MKILVLSIAPIFKEFVHGGSQRILMNILENLSIKNEIKVFCTSRKDNHLHFKIGKAIDIFPILPFREFFPFPYMTNPKNITRIIEIINSESKWADCIYIHADGYLLKGYLQKFNKPVMVSYHDFVYPITISSAFLGDVDKIIFPSEYLSQCFLNTVGTLYSNIKERIEIITNGINPSIFFKDISKERELKEKYGIKKDEKVLLFPHRPEKSKGVIETLQLLQKLTESGENVRLLFPKYIDLKYDIGICEDYKILNELLIKMNISQYVSFFPWLPHNEMRHIYSLSNICLNTGNFTEAFGLVPLESLLCETPVISTKSGNLRHILAFNYDGIETYDYGDNENLLFLTRKLLHKKDFNFKDVHSYIKKRFNFKKMLEHYDRSFMNLAKKPLLKHNTDRNNDFTKFKIAPWCYVSDKGIYDDYIGNYHHLDKITLIKCEKNIIIKRNDLGNYFEELVSNNVIIPFDE